MVENYLPMHLFGRAEFVLAKPSVGPIGPIELEDEPRLDALFALISKSISLAITQCKKLYDLDEAIYFCLVDTHTINAVAFRLEAHTYCIAFSIELIVRTWMTGGYFEICEAMKEAFPNDNAPALITPKNCDALPRVSIWPQKFEMEARQRSTRGLGAAAMMTFVFHELGHIINGHVALMPQLAVTEIVPPEIEIDKIKHRRALEFDADCFAALQMLRHFHGTPRRIAIHLCSTDSDHLKFAVTATLTCLCVFAASEQYNANWAKTPTTHPAALDRLFATAECLLAIIQRDNPERSARAINDEIVGPALKAVLGSLRLVHQYEVIGLDEHANQAFEMYLAEVRASWAKLYPMLMKTKLGSCNLAPPHAGFTTG